MFANTVRWYAGCLLFGFCATCTAADVTGPETEKRFPPLKVPPGFKATLFACDPLIEYPSAIALGPVPGTLFVAVDYMTGLGTEIVRRSEIRLFEDTDADGYADKSTVYADGFNSIEGLTSHSGAVYAMHAPLLTALRDTDVDGKADVRNDLVKGLGLTPEENPVRLHCANGLVMGHDGWLYLALGDHGCEVTRPEGDRLVFHGGGILRCRPDGRDLHLFASGLRNIYDVALDDELNVFVRDNENDGGDYKIRVCHSFFGADHGYPYLYYERPDEALRPLADLGLGSSAGGLCYLEHQFPAEYRGNLFFCEWGRSVVRYPLTGAGSSFGPVREIEFAAGADKDPYGFKPTDLVVERDGSLIIADWADGQRPKRGRGRIYRIQYQGETPASGVRQLPGSSAQPLSVLLKQLDSPGYFERFQAQDAISARGADAVATVIAALDGGKIGRHGQLHAIWILARDGSTISRDKLFQLVQNHPEPRIQAQAVRALADLIDPILVAHRLDAEPGPSETAARLAGLTGGKDLRVMREIVIALGRLRWPQFPGWLQQAFPASTSTAPNPLSTDAALAHAAMQSLRRSGNWSAVLSLLDLPDSDPRRRIAQWTVADQAIPELVDGIIARLSNSDPDRRREYADLLTRIHKQPADWVYWGYRPPPRLPNTKTWKRTAAIEQALDRVLGDPAPAVRLALLLRMQREKVPTQLATLERWLPSERNPAAVAAILESLRDHPKEQVHPSLARVVTSRDHTSANRLAALSQLVSGVDDSNAGRLLELARAAEDGPVLAALLRQLGLRPRLESDRLLIDKLGSPHADVRSAAAAALSELRLKTSGDAVRKLLSDSDANVRHAAATAMGRLEVRAAIEELLRLTTDAEGNVRRASLDSLRMLREPRAIAPAVAALGDRQTHTAALELLGELGAPEQSQPVIEAAQRDPAPEVIEQTVRLLSRWSQSTGLPVIRQSELEREIAALQGRSGLLLRWKVVGPLPEIAAGPMAEQVARSDALATLSLPATATTLFASSLDGRLDLVNQDKNAPTVDATNGVWLAVTDVVVPESTLVQFLGAANGKLHIWLNGQQLHRRDEIRTLQPDSDRFEGTFREGPNRLVLQLAQPRGSAVFQLRFRRKNSTAEFEQLAQAALTRPGNAERGGKIFFDQTKSQCSKCHRIGDQGERIGPELTGIGSRFSRIHLVESILEPSRAVAPGFQAVAVLLRSGRVITGIKVSDSATTLTLGDNQGQKHEILKNEIEQQQPQTQSIMPDGLTKLLTTDQFVDLIAFLTGQKENRETRATDAK